MLGPSLFRIAYGAPHRPTITWPQEVCFCKLKALYVSHVLYFRHPRIVSALFSQGRHRSGNSFRAIAKRDREGWFMKANKVHKRLAKIEALISDVSGRYSTGASHIREAIQDAVAAFARVKAAVSSQAASGTARQAPGKRKKAAVKKEAAKAKAGKTAKKSAPKKKAAKKAAAKKTDPAPVKKVPVPAKRVAAPVEPAAHQPMRSNAEPSPEINHDSHHSHQDEL
jgi:hypothetical protein